MPEEVKYEMTLNDLVSPKLHEAEGHAKKFETSLSGLKEGLVSLGERALRVGETLGISFAFIKLEEFFHEGIEKAHEFHIAEGQLENTLKNVGERAGLTGEELVDMARKTAKEIPFTTVQIVQMETALSRFGNMSPKVYQQVLAMSADIATALKRDGTEVATTLGRIMEAPAENGRLLRQLNVTLTMEQRKYLTQLERTGQLAKAQTFIFQELATKGYGGAAAAAANTDPLFRYNKIMGSLKMEMGNVGIAVLHNLAPALETVASWVKIGYEEISGLIGYLQKNATPILHEIKNDLIAVGAGVAFVGAAFLAANPHIIAYGVSVAADAVISGALAAATGVLTAAQWLLNIALDANPIGIVVVAIGAAITGTILLYQHSAKFRAILDGIGAVAKDVFIILKSLYIDLPMAALSAHPFDAMKAALNNAVAAGKDIGSAFGRGYNESMAESAKKDAEEKNKDTALGRQAKKKEGKPGMPTMIGGKGSSSSKVSGTKTVNIHVQIGNLVKELKIQTTNMKEAPARLHDMVTKVLTDAVNDSQIIADAG